MKIKYAKNTTFVPKIKHLSNKEEDGLLYCVPEGANLSNRLPTTKRSIRGLGTPFLDLTVS